MSDSVWPHRRQPTRLPRPWDSPGKNTGVGCHFLLQCMKVKSESEVAQSCPTCSDPMDCSLPGSSIHGVFQARVLEWVAISFSDMWFYFCFISKFICFFFSTRTGVRHSPLGAVRITLGRSTTCLGQKQRQNLYSSWAQANPRYEMVHTRVLGGTGGMKTFCEHPRSLGK